ncbi:MAG: hypothetical protein IT433_05935 [Phycisphaerales bacterium]|nr:hypothetical protein [Phycisphaerales bacterium]
MTKPKKQQKTNVKETITSVVIAFTMAFVFRGFVIEAFLIPTGSMAPTLNGAHMRFASGQTGYQWSTDTWYKDRRTDTPYPVQDASAAKAAGRSPRDGVAVRVHDPMSGAPIEELSVPTSWGDRIFVMKYLADVYDPQRFDVVVFKNPYDPSMNFIKRLLGLPGEMVALVDGDVFVRQSRPDDPAGVNTWTLPGWTVARKPERAQRAMWQEVFASDYAPLDPVRANRRWFASPWRADEATSSKWEIADKRSYSYTGGADTTLTWDTSIRPIDDRYAYNETPDLMATNLAYPVSDVRIRAGVQPGADGLRVSAVLRTRGHEFRADVAGQSLTLRMKPLEGGEWSVLGEGGLPEALRAGHVTNLDFWFVDQSIIVYCEDDEVARGLYAWSPDERLRRTVGFGAEAALQDGNDSLINMASRGAGVSRYPTPRVSLEFAGGAVTLHRLTLSRDIYYQPARYAQGNTWGLPHSRAGRPAAATHPAQPANLTGEEYFVCGDNSPASLDARLWDQPHPWVAEIDDHTGVVHHDLMIGKAFFVYFPSPHKRRSLPIPDFGHMRFIW